MQVVNSSRHSLGGTRSSAASGFASKAQVISLYNEPPQEELTIDEFEQFALDRKALLNGIERIKTSATDKDTLNAGIKKVSPRSADYLTSYVPCRALCTNTNALVNAEALPS